MRKFHRPNIAHYFLVSPEVAHAALANLLGVRKYLTKDHWIKGQYTFNNEISDNPRVCLIGAVERLNGKGEILAAAIMHSVASGKIVLPEADLKDSPFEVDYKYIIHQSRAHSEAQSFNDSNQTYYPHIQKFLDFCIKFAQDLAKSKPLPKRKAVPIKKGRG